MRFIFECYGSELCKTLLLDPISLMFLYSGLKMISYQADLLKIYQDCNRVIIGKWLRHEYQQSSFYCFHLPQRQQLHYQLLCSPTLHQFMHRKYNQLKCLMLPLIIPLPAPRSQPALLPKQVLLENGCRRNERVSTHDAIT